MEQLGIQNPTLRDCFDTGCSEYNDTTIDEKIQTLKKIIDNGISLQSVLIDYCEFYRRQNKPYVARDLHIGLKTLINHLLRNKTQYTIKLTDDYENSELVGVLNLLLINTTKYPIELKQIFYKHLVNKRKKYDFEKIELINPAKVSNGNYDGNHLNAWANWHGDLDAEILLIGQDFSDVSYFEKNKGNDNPNNPTNEYLQKLFKQIDIEINTKMQAIPETKIYFTNAILGLKKGGMAAPIKKQWYSDTAERFIKPLIRIIEPKIIITMGSAAYNTIAIIYKLKISPLKNIVNCNPIILPDDKKLFAVYHCSGLGIRNRKFIDQLADWKKIKEYLN